MDPLRIAAGTPADVILVGRHKGRTARAGSPSVTRLIHYYICSRADKTAGIDCKKNHLDAVEADHHVLGYVKQLALRDDLVRMENEPPDAMLQQSREFEREKTELETTLSRMGDEIAKQEQTSMRVDMAGKTLRYLAGILDHTGMTADHLKDCLPKFINYVIWRKDVGAHKGRFEVALFERPFRADRGRLLREVVEDLRAGSNGNGHKASETHTPRPPAPPERQSGQNGAACGSSCSGFAAECNKG
jgi:hypothetical protein